MRKLIYNQLSALLVLWTLLILISPVAAQKQNKSTTYTPRRINQDISAVNTSRRLNKDQWEWTVFINAYDQVLRNISCVEYKPQSTSTNSSKKVCTRGTGNQPFAYSGKSLGTLDIYITIFFKDKQTPVTLKHRLKF
ncbi:MAG TPA: hypothetical protein VF596_13115 [Pyrinomonadaceae bacterium]|jgi:transcription initiation factor IIF auxiliary subunit